MCIASLNSCARRFSCILQVVPPPEELAGALLYLSSQASSFVTGQVIAVDGGLSASIGMAPVSQELRELFLSAVPDGLAEPIVPESGGFK